MDRHLKPAQQRVRDLPLAQQAETLGYAGVAQMVAMSLAGVQASAELHRRRQVEGYTVKEQAVSAGIAAERRASHGRLLLLC